MWVYMFDDFDNWAFVWDLPPPSCPLLHHLPLLPSSHPWCRYCCDIFLSSIPEVIWLVKLHLFPRPPLGVLLFDFLSGWLQSLSPCPWSATLAANTPSNPSSWRWPHIYHHGDNLCTAVCATPTLGTQQSHWCLCTHTHVKTHMHTHCINIREDFVGCFHCLVFLWAAVSPWEVWKSGESKFMEFK